MDLGTMGVAVPVAEKPPSEIVRGMIGTAVPLAEKPISLMVRGPDAPPLVGACLGPAPIAGAEVGTATSIAPGVTL